MERYNGWLIDGFLSDGRVILDAKIVPDIENLYLLLKSKGVVSEPIKNIADYIQYGDGSNMSGVERQMSRMYLGANFVSSVNQNDLAIFMAMVNIGSHYQYSTTKKSHAILSIEATGSEFTRRRAMNKIKKYINENLPNIQREIILQLKKNKLIPDWVEVF